MANELEQLSEWRGIAADLADRQETARECMASLAVEAWRAGSSYRRIAAVSGYSHQRVHQIVRAGLGVTDSA